MFLSEPVPRAAAVTPEPTNRSILDPTGSGPAFRTPQDAAAEPFCKGTFRMKRVRKGGIVVREEYASWSLIH